MRRWLFGCLAAQLLMLPAVAWAQRTAKVVPGEQYYMSPFMQAIVGANWRDVWNTAVVVPVLDLNTFGGGLTAFRQGGNQSLTLRLRGGDGKTYIFRSTDKFVHKALPEDLAHTPVGELIQDQSSTMHPTGQLVVTPLQEKLGLLQARPQLVLMPDDARLGEFRKTFAGMLGQIEERPDEAEGDGPVSFGAKDIEDSEKLLEELEQSLDHRLDSREYLAARLIDFMIGDTDRGADQWRWARFERGELEVYRPIPRDRDYAFMAADGLLPSLVRAAFPKIVMFGPKFSPLRGYTFMTQEFDRSHLVELPWPVWDSLVTRIQSEFTDAVITDAVARLPREHRAVSGPDLVDGLRTRRANLRTIVRDYYNMVVREADVFASNEADVAEIERQRDGSVDVHLYSQRAAAAATNGDRVAAFTRRFSPLETKEIRVYMQDGNDRVIVRGAAEHSIKVRVTGGAGDDVLVDSSRVSQGGHPTVFYDASGRNTFTPGPGTRVSEMPFVTAQPKEEVEEGQQPKPRVVQEERRGHFQDLMAGRENFIQDKITTGATQYWGGRSGFGPTVDYREGAGPILGFGYATKRYGFRHQPYESKISLNALYAIGSSGFGLEARGDFRTENAPLAFDVLVRASQFEANRFFGYGNDTPDIGRDLSLVLRDELLIQPAARWYFTQKDWVGVGPLVRYIKSRPEGGSPADTLRGGFDSIEQLGVQALTRFDRRDSGINPHQGYTLTGGAAFYPPMWDVEDAYARAHVQGTAYLPVGKPTVALRLGASRVFGTFPLHDAAFLGGRHTLRGFRWNRFAGDAEVHSTAELRVPLARVTLLTRGLAGAFVFADAGRVWMDGSSPGGWHSGYGAGFSFLTLGSAFSVSYARGEHSRVYFSYGLPF
jgi:hypothetical protein